MRRLLLVFLTAGLLFGWNQEEDINVNSRYTVEGIQFAGARATSLKPNLRKEVNAVVGQRLDYGVLERLAVRIRRDLRVENVSIRVLRGRLPEHVTVEFEVRQGHKNRFDVDVTKFAYHARQGWTGAGEASTRFGDTTVAAGLVSDGDALVERFSGIRARVEQRGAGSSRVRLQFGFDSYHPQWNPSTLAAEGADPAEFYRARHNFQPTATVVLAESLTWTTGASFQQLRMQFPSTRTVAAHSVINTLRFHKGWEDSSSSRHALDAGYNLRAATRILASDYVYVRHMGDLRYEITNGRHQLTLDFLGGGVNGKAPMFERFILGNASTLRGWNKFDIAPLGADRIAHGAVDYRYRVFTVFYDAGVLWTGSTSTGTKQSAGLGFRTSGRDGFLLALAFPLYAGRFDPVFIMGFNF
jgi:hypothetical protein